MIRDLTLSDALEVVADMRPEDARCVRAVSGKDPGEWFAAERWQVYGPAWCLLQGGRPQAIGGLALRNGWSGLFWMVCRPGMNGESWRKALRATRTVLDNAMHPENPERRHRIEAHVLHGWAGASRFAERLGMRLEGVLRGAGSGGESIEVWACVKGVK